MLQYRKDNPPASGIAIIGIGGGGANVLKCFNGSSAANTRLYIMSLDERLSQACGNVEFIQLGEGVSHGLGSGGDPEVGKRAMLESEQKVRDAISNCKLVVMVVGLGGGTGSGAGPVLARLAKEVGVFLVSVVMMPFSFEGNRRREQAMDAFEQVSCVSDIVLCFENDYMEELFRDRSGAREVFEEVNRLLAKATAAVPMMATSPGLINLGLDELAAVFESSDSRCIFGSGSSVGKERIKFGSGSSDGPERAKQAALAAVDSPLMRYHGALRFARTVIVHVAGGNTLSLNEIYEVMDVVQKALGSDDVRIFFGAAVKEELVEVKVTIIASIDAEEFKAACATAPVPGRPEGDTAEQSATAALGEETGHVTPENAVEERPIHDEEEAAGNAVPDATGFTGHSEGGPVPAEADVGTQDTPPVDGEATPPSPSVPNSESGEQLYDDATYPGSTQSGRQETSSRQATSPSKRQLDLFHDPSTPHHRNNETGTYADSHGGKRNTSPQDDLDTPPSMRNGDSRDIFPDR